MGENEQKKHISPNARQAWGLVECWDSRSKGDVDWAAAVGGDYSEKQGFCQARSMAKKASAVWRRLG